MKIDRLRYVHLRTDNGGAVTLAIMPDGVSRAVVGVAACSPNDNFCRRVGRDAALPRAADPGDVMRFTSTVSGDRQVRMQDVMTSFGVWLARSPHVPGWLQSACVFYSSPGRAVAYTSGLFDLVLLGDQT